MRRPFTDTDGIEALADLLHAPVFLADASGCLQYASTQCRNFLGLKPSDSSFESWHLAIHPSDRKVVADKWSEATTHGRACNIEFRLQRDDGPSEDAVWQAAPFFDESGRVAGWVGVCHDVGEDVRRETALRELAHELEERVKELNCLYGISHIVERSGGSLDMILGETVELLPRSWEYAEIASARITLDGQEYPASDFEETPWRQTADLKVHGEVVGRVEVVYLEERPERDEGPFLAGERALLNAIAERLGHIVERLRAEEWLHEREAELRGRLTHLGRVGEVGEMASSIAHEVNQPLSAITLYAQAGHRLAQAGSLAPGAADDLLSRIAADALRAGAIIHRLGNLVRRQDVNQVACDVNALIRDVTHLVAVDARLHDVTLTLDLASGLPTVLADGVQIQQVVLNLVRNAIDSMAETDRAAGAVVVRSKRAGNGHIVVSVEDDGCGLADDAEEHLFQPFFTTKEGGMGMGLSISRTIAAAHGGRLWFERKPTRGTIFHLELPPADEERDASA